MKITFISLIEDVSIPGLRFLSAFIKKKGHKSEIIMLPRSYSEGLNDHVSFLYAYSDIVLEQLVEKCRDSDLIGLSLMSCHFDNAVYITRYLKKHLSIPIIWGGIHPTIRPLECLEYTDIVCMGESELSLSMLMEKMANGEDWKTASVQGILKQGEKNDEFLPGPILEDLKELPLPDYDLEDQFLLYKKNQIVQFNKDLLNNCLGDSYRMTCSRGCSYACTYCCNNALNKIYKRKLPIRERAIEDIIAELKIIKGLIPKLREIDIADDAFFAQSQGRIDEFCQEYKKEINLPFKVLTTPPTFIISKAKELAKAGMSCIAVGIQSGSLRIRAIYNRYDTLEQILTVGDIVNQVAKETKKRISVRYDFILDNPWEDEEDIKDSIRFVLKLKKHFSLMLFSLTFYPETALYKKARREGIIYDDLNQIYRRTQLAVNRNYLNALLELAGLGMSKFLVEFFLDTNIPKKYLVNLLYFLVNLYTLKKGLRSVIVKGFLRGDFRWVYIAFLIFFGRIKQKFISVEHTELVKFKGKVGEIQ